MQFKIALLRVIIFLLSKNRFFLLVRNNYFHKRKGFLSLLFDFVVLIGLARCKVSKVEGLQQRCQVLKAFGIFFLKLISGFFFPILKKEF